MKVKLGSRLLLIIVVNYCAAMSVVYARCLLRHSRSVLCSVLLTVVKLRDFIRPRRSYIAGTLPSQCHTAPQITVFHLNLALYKFHYLLTYLLTYLPAVVTGG